MDESKVTRYATEKYVDENIPPLDGYANKNNPVFTGSISLGRTEGTTVGENSFAIGDAVNASGDFSHAEGWSSKALGVCSHAEGSSTTASGDFSHAEGEQTKASGSRSHAEGSNTTASGNSSHAEGTLTEASSDSSHAEGYNTIASGDSSHTEGWVTTASGDRSHAEGCWTKASSEDQHVQGKYNIEDIANKYAHIVGNGKYDTINKTEVRSNAHTLDWEGNAWYAGKLSQEGIPTENKDLVTKKYVDDMVGDIQNTLNTIIGGGQ